MSYVVDLHRPESGDVVDLILADHRLFEELLRGMRDVTSDRAALRDALAAVLVAHAEAEEKRVYPKLKRRTEVGSEEVEHSEEEHAEGHEALLKLMELDDTSSSDFDDALEELSGTLNHHLTEEELSILNPARTDTTEEVRTELGAQFAAERNRLIDEGCGSIDVVRGLVERAREKGQLDGED